MFRACQSYRPSLEGLEDRTLLPAGVPDTSFGSGGDGTVTVPFDIGAYGDRAYAMLCQPDGKILVAGAANTTTNNYDFAIARLLSDGSLDTDFGSGGKTVVAFDLGGNFDDQAQALALQSDGKILVAGFARATSTGGDYDFAVVRLLSNGQLDTDFDGDSKVTIAFNLGGTTGSRNNDQVNAIALQSDGKIIVAGFAKTPVGANSYDFAVARLLSDGQLDANLDGDGKATVNFDLSGTNDDDQANAVALQSDGKIVLAGFAKASGISNYDFAVARLSSDGTLDTDFDFDGKASIAFNLGSLGYQDDKAYNVALQSDGKIVVAGYARATTTGNDFDFAVARLSGSGQLDTDFDGDGKATVAFNLVDGNLDDQAKAVALQPDGKIVVAGHANKASTNYDFAIVRLEAGGAFDTTFGSASDGKATIAFDRTPAYHDDKATAITLQTSGQIVSKIVVAGYALVGAGNYDFGIARLLGDEGGGASPGGILTADTVAAAQPPYRYDGSRMTLPTEKVPSISAGNGPVGPFQTSALFIDGSLDHHAATGRTSCNSDSGQGTAGVHDSRRGSLWGWVLGPPAERGAGPRLGGLPVWVAVIL